jgi:hypothetical protein
MPYYRKMKKNCRVNFENLKIIGMQEDDNLEILQYYFEKWQKYLEQKKVLLKHYLTFQLKWRKTAAIYVHFSFNIKIKYFNGMLKYRQDQQ